MTFAYSYDMGSFNQNQSFMDQFPFAGPQAQTHGENQHQQDAPGAYPWDKSEERGQGYGMDMGAWADTGSGMGRGTGMGTPVSLTRGAGMGSGGGMNRGAGGVGGRGMGRGGAGMGGGTGMGYGGGLSRGAGLGRRGGTGKGGMGGGGLMNYGSGSDGGGGMGYGADTDMGGGMGYGAGMGRGGGVAGRGGAMSGRGKMSYGGETDGGGMSYGAGMGRGGEMGYGGGMGEMNYGAEIGGGGMSYGGEGMHYDGGMGGKREVGGDTGYEYGGYGGEYQGYPESNYGYGGGYQLDSGNMDYFGDAGFMGGFHGDGIFPRGGRGAGGMGWGRGSGYLRSLFSEWGRGGIRGGRGRDRGRDAGRRDRRRERGGRGKRGSAGGRGRGDGTGRKGKGSPRTGEPITSDSGVDLKYLGDLVQSAKSRKETDQPTASGEFSTLDVLVEEWKTFAESFADCGNSISNMECSLKASKVQSLLLDFDSTLLVKHFAYRIFTGVLNLKKTGEDGATAETKFLARGLGLTKKAAKMDCYEKAHNLLLTAPVQEITSQEDCGEAILKEEISILHKKNPQGLTDLLKKSNVISEAESGASSRGSGGKRPANPKNFGPEFKRARYPDHLSGMLELKSVSLAPEKKIGILMKPTDPLIAKLTKLKELLKEEGITKLHIVPKIDQIAHKTAIHIKNVYRFQDVPILGFESRMPVYCEIYFDDIFMAAGDSDFKRNTAMQSAYKTLTDTLCTQPLESLVTSERYWMPYMTHDPDVCNVVTKWQGEDNNCILTSNLANMKQMMQSMPDVTIPIDRMVLTEHESDKGIENVFKALELSATRNLMLLECEITRNPDMKFTCSMSLQGKQLCSRSHSTKNGAKRLCSESIMNDMKNTHDYIYVSTDYIGRTITREELIIEAEKLLERGDPPAKIFYKKTEPKVEPGMPLEQKQKIELDRERHQEMENQPEHVAVQHLIPWMASALYEIIEDYYRKVTLEDLLINLTDMPKSQRDMVTAVATKMGLRVITKFRNTQMDKSLLRRTVTAQDMCKILQLHGGECGRYKLVTSKNPYSTVELNKYKKEALAQLAAMKAARENDDPNAAPAAATVKGGAKK